MVRSFFEVVWDSVMDCFVSRNKKEVPKKDLKVCKFDLGEEVRVNKQVLGVPVPKRYLGRKGKVEKMSRFAYDEYELGLKFPDRKSLLYICESNVSKIL